MAETSASPLLAGQPASSAPPTPLASRGASPSPLMAGLPRDLTAPPPIRAARTSRDLQRAKSDHTLRDGSVSPTSWWSKCNLVSCCDPKPSNDAAADHSRHHGSATRSHREVDEPAPSPPALPTNFDLNSAEGSALAQLAGGIWLSQILQRLWPHLSTAMETMIRTEMFPDLVENTKPSWMEGITLDKLTLGDKVPIVRNVHVHPADDDDDVKEVRLQLEVTWHSGTDIQLTVKPLPAVLNKYLSKYIPNVITRVVQYMTSINVGVQNLSLQSQMLVTLAPITDVLPVVKAWQLSMLRTPDIDFDITITKGESTILNVLKPYLRTLIASAFTPYVIPEHVGFPIEDGTPDLQKPEGVLLVRVLRAVNIPKMDYWGHSDTYVDLWTRGRIKRRTPVVKNSANPEWPSDDSSFQLLVHTRRFQVLSFELWDQDKDMNDDLIGGASVRLVDLQPGKEHELCLKVVNAASGSAGEDAPPGLDPAYAGGRSTVDVSHTKLHVLARYVPAALAPLFEDQIGNPGVFSMHLKKVTVPDLALLPVRARPYITGQHAPTVPPLSPLIEPMKGKDPVTGMDRIHKRDIPQTFDAAWDVLGSTEEVARCMFVLEMVANVNVKNVPEKVLARVDVPLAHIMQNKITCVPGGGAGGSYTLRSETGWEFELVLLWSPLLGDTGAAVSSANNGAVGLQQLLHSTTDIDVNARRQEVVEKVAQEVFRHSATDVGPRREALIEEGIKKVAEDVAEQVVDQAVEERAKEVVAKQEKDWIKDEGNPGVQTEARPAAGVMGVISSKTAVWNLGGIKIEETVKETAKETVRETAKEEDHEEDGIARIGPQVTPGKVVVAQDAGSGSQAQTVVTVEDKAPDSKSKPSFGTLLEGLSF